MSEHIATDEMVLVPWDRMIRLLQRRGWAQVPAVFRASLLTKLARGGRSAALALGRFDPADGPEFAIPIERSPDVVRDLSLRLSASLSVAASLQGLAEPPLFNEVSWCWLSASDASHSVLRPLANFVGITVRIRLYGSAVINASDPTGRQGSSDTHAGHLVLVQSGRWPAARSPAISLTYVHLLPPGCFEVILRTSHSPGGGRCVAST